MSLWNYLSKQRVLFSLHTKWTKFYKLFSANVYNLYTKLEQLIKDNTFGKTLDAGSWNLNFSSILKQYSKEYVSFDLNQDNKPDYVWDIQNLTIFENDLFDFIFCSQVFEYVFEPTKALSEFNRVLKPKWKLLLSFPFMCWLHDEPYDLYRYSFDWMKKLLEINWFIILKHYNVGGLFELFTHNISFVLVLMFWSINVFNYLVLYLNFVLIVCPTLFFDKILKLNKKFPTNIIILAQKI